MSEPVAEAPGAERAAGERLAPLGLIVTALGRLPDLIVPTAAALYGTRGTDLGALPVIALVLALSLLFRWLGWRRFRYFVGADDIRIERGLISRSARSVPYERIADVSIEQPALARVLGLAMVRFETGGGKGEEAELRFVTEAEAARLRETVRARKAGGGTPASDAAEEEPPARLLLAMDGARLIRLGFYSFSLVIFAVLFGLAQQLDFLLPFGWSDVEAWLGAAGERGLAVTGLDRTAQLLGALSALAALVAVGIATGIARTVLTDHGFRLERTAKGLRRRRGLLTHTDVTIPVERVQAVRIGTGPIRLRGGWHDLRLVSLASESARESHHMVAPLARLDEIWPIAGEVEIARPAPDLVFFRAHRGPWLVRAGLVVVPFAAWSAVAAAQGLPLAGLLIVPGLVLGLRRLLLWRQARRAVDATLLHARGGWWNRSWTIARKVNVQSVSLGRGPIERLFGLATLDFGIPGGTLQFPAVPLAEARAIREAVLDVVAPVDFSRLARGQ